MSEIETKFKKKKESAMRKLKTKIFKEDEGEKDNFAENFIAKAEGVNNMAKTKKEDIR